MTDLFELKEAVDQLQERGYKIGPINLGPDSKIEVDGKMYSPDDVIRLAKELPTQS